MAMTSAQIVALALQIAKAPGYTSQAGQLLNMILADLCEWYDFAVAKKVYNFNFNTSLGFGPFFLPSDFLRAKNKDVYYTIDNVPYPMIAITKQEFDWTVQQAGDQSYPSFYTIDMSTTPPGMYTWPQPSGAFPVTVNYYAQMPDITTPETSTTIPWFPNQSYLLARLAGEIMRITDDERAGQYLGDSMIGGIEGAQSLLNKYLKLKDNAGDTVKRVDLDRRMFGRTYNARLPNTKTIGW